MPSMPRKCSRDDCPKQNISPDLTWYCFGCKGPIHLLCYNIVKNPEEVFVNDNIVMICDECLSNPKETVSPKRKQPNVTTNLVQSTIDMQNPILTLTKAVPAVSTPTKIVTIKQSQQIQAVMESLVQKVETQTATIAGLQASVEVMNDTILQQKVAVGESIKTNNESMSMIKQTLVQSPSFNNSNRKVSYAEAAKQGIKKATVNETPKSSKYSRTPRSTKPILPGTSKNVIGKPISPRQMKTNDRTAALPKPEKAVWISRLHRDTTEEELASYIKDSIGIAALDFDVRKLVKKDRDLSTYSFVSFRITCSQAHFPMLMQTRHWPSDSVIREFDLEQKSSTGVRLNRQSPNKESEPKNLESTRTESMDTTEPKTLSTI